MTSRSFDLLNSKIYWSRWSVDLRWMIEPYGATLILGDLVFWQLSPSLAVSISMFHFFLFWCCSTNSLHFSQISSIFHSFDRALIHFVCQNFASLFGSLLPRRSNQWFHIEVFRRASPKTSLLITTHIFCLFSLCWLSSQHCFSRLSNLRGVLLNCLKLWKVYDTVSDAVEREVQFASKILTPLKTWHHS